MEYCPHCIRPAEGAICPLCGGNMNAEALPGQLPIGTLLAGSDGKTYQIGAARGQGGFGVTYAGMDLTTSGRVAIKEYYPSRFSVRTNINGIVPMTGQEAVFNGGKRSFLKEAEMLFAVGALKSVVSVIDFFEANGTAYLVMEFIDGRPLHAIVGERGKFPADEFLPKLPALMDDLIILHRAGIIHRDIAPDNLILMPDGKIKLIDFGSARSMTQDVKTVLVKGSFSPVEQYGTTSVQGAFTDVYAFASTVYYCLTGQLPPLAAERMQSDVLARPNSLGVNLRQHEEEAILWGMMPIPENRPQDMEILKNSLFPKGWYEFPKRNIGGTGIGGIFGGGNKTVTLDHEIKDNGGVTATGGDEAKPIRNNVGIDPTDNNKTEKKTDIGGITSPKPKKPIGIGMILLIAIPSVIVLALIIFGVIYGSTHGTTDDGFVYTIETHGEGHARIAGYEGDGGDITIPTKIKGYVVDFILEDAFKGCTNISSVTANINQKCVDDAFTGCTGITKFYLTKANSEIDTYYTKGHYGEHWEPYLEACANLRVIILADLEDYSDAVDNVWFAELSNVAICYIGQDTGHGLIRSVEVVDGVAYGLTNQNYAVALKLPIGVSESALPPKIGMFSVVSPSGNIMGGESSDIGDAENNGTDDPSGNTGTEEPIPTETVGVTDDGFKFIISADQKECTITGYESDESLVIFPHDIDGVTVNKIGDGAFAGNSEIYSLILPANLESVGEDAFKNCVNLTDVTFFSSIECHYSAFDGCEKLRAALICTDGAYMTGCDIFGELVAFDYGMETGTGLLTYIYVDENGIVYGVTEDESACVLDVPSAGGVEFYLLETLGDYTVDWIYEEALENRYDDVTLYMTPETYLPYSIVEKHFYSEYGLSLYFDYDEFSPAKLWATSCAYTMELMRMVDENRSGSIEENTDDLLIAAAIVRAEELKSEFSYARPDGSNWGTALNELGIEFEYGYSFIYSYGMDDGDSDLYNDFVSVSSEFAVPEAEWENEYYTDFAVGFSVDEASETIYVCTIAVIN